MADQRPVTKEQLLDQIGSSWDALNTAIDKLPEAQLSTPTDAEGWGVKDHLTHMAAWERSVVFLLEGKPRHEGLGVSEEVYSSGDDDRINRAIYSRHKDLSPADALTEFRDVHSRMMGLLEPMSDADLQRPYSHYLPNETGRAEDSPVLGVIAGNTVGHFQEHLGWIQELLGKAGEGREAE